MHRIFCSVIPQAGEEFRPEAREAEHLFKVFRARPGEAVELLDGRGSRARGAVIEQKMIRIESVETAEIPAEKLHLCCALPRRQKLDALLKQAAELGAWTIRPMRCERSVAEGNPRERWELLLQEACKQSGNPFLPEILRENTLKDTLEALKMENVDIYFGSVKVVDHAARNLPKEREKAILIGPEGGFSDAELELITSYGAVPLNLGPHILRLETAAVAALAVLRLLAIPFLLGVMLFASGCGQGDISKNPLMIKAEQLRQDGSFADARRFLRQVIARYPESPEGYLALGKLCEEELNDKLEALYCYRNFIQLVPENDSRRAAVEKYISAIETKLAAEFAEASPEVEKLRRLVKGLNDEAMLAKRVALRNQQKVEQLEKKLRSATPNRRKRK